MKNRTILFGSVLVAALMLASVAVAVKPNGPSAYNGLNKGKSSVKHLYLYEKDSSWNVVPGGAWGKMRFDDDSFVFNGHGLEAGYDYTLIYYPDPWPGTGCMALGYGTAGTYGNVHIMEAFDFTSLPDNSKIWLVLDSDENCDGDTGKMTGWNPTEYLFEYDLI